MNDKETRYSNVEMSFSKKIINVIIYLIIPIILLLVLIYVNMTDFNDKTDGWLNIILFYSFLFIILRGTSKLAGVEEGKKVIYKEDNIVKKTNPYIYYRELPNDYGIGVISLLVDSKLENYKDIIAVILDLCAKKYLFLEKIDNKYYIKVLKGIDNKLLSNERYILGLIISNNLININYQEWYSYCLQDGINLGVYYHVDRQQSELDNKFKLNGFRIKNVKIVAFIVIIFMSFLMLLMVKYGKLFIDILNIMFVIISFFVILFVLFFVKLFLNKIKDKNEYQKKTTYNMTLNNHLYRTEKGVIELQKLLSFKNFLMDFGNIVSKSPLEVVLWDRYLSYAVVFNLTKDIMKTGYKQLIKNSSFQIDDIDNITINNIEIDNRL